jgi:hypothetical protein
MFSLLIVYSLLLLIASKSFCDPKCDPVLFRECQRSAPLQTMTSSKLTSTTKCDPENALVESKLAEIFFALKAQILLAPPLTDQFTH